MDENTVNAFRAAQARATALRSVGKKDDYIVDSLMNLPTLPPEAKKILKDAKVSGASAKAVSDILELPVKTGTSYNESDYETPGLVGGAARFLGIEKAGRFIGSKLASFDPEYQKNVRQATELGEITPETATQMSRGGVSNRELVGSIANVGLNVALPFAGKALAAGSTAAKLGKAAGVGAAFGAAGGANEGQDLGGIATSAVLGGALGAGTAGLFMAGAKGLQGFQKYREELVGINPQTRTILEELPDPTKFNKYVESAKARNLDIRQNSPLGIAAQELESAGTELKKQIRTAGTAVGEAKKAAAKVEMPDLNDVIHSFEDDIASRFGVQLSIRKGGVGARTIPGTQRAVDAGDKKRIVNAYKDLIKLQKGGTVRRASDVLSNLDELVDYSKADQFGVVRDPLEGVLKSTRHSINEKMREASPSLAEANDIFSALKDAEKFVASTAGKDLGRGELLLRRVFSGDKSREALDVLDVIKKYTGKDLVQDAVLARLAVEQFGDKAQKTLLQQAIETGVMGGGGIVGRTLRVAGDAATKLTLPDTERLARKIIGSNRSLPEAIGPKAGEMFFHGTSKENAQSIARTGFDPSKSSRAAATAEAPDAFYAARSKEDASWYGNSFIKIKPKEDAKILPSTGKVWYEIAGKSMSSKESIAARAKLKSMGYDAVDFGNELEILNPDKFHIRSTDGKVSGAEALRIIKEQVKQSLGTTKKAVRSLEPAIRQAGYNAAGRFLGGS